MREIKFICVGRMREKHYMEAFSEYKKRLGAYCRFELAEIEEQRLPEKPSDREIKAALLKEGLEIKKQIPKDAYVCCMCVEGKQKSSEELAELMLQRENSGKPKLCFIIGGSYGICDEVKNTADFKLSMSKMTFPHHLARVMLIEQVYRGFKIIEGSRYHK